MLNNLTAPINKELINKYSIIHKYHSNLINKWVLGTIKQTMATIQKRYKCRHRLRQIPVENFKEGLLLLIPLEVIWKTITQCQVVK